MIFKFTVLYGKLLFDVSNTMENDFYVYNIMENDFFMHLIPLKMIFSCI